MTSVLTNRGAFRTVRQPHQLTFLNDEVVAKVVRCPDSPRVRHVYVDGVTPWREFQWLRQDEIEQLQLDPGRWLLAVRDFTPGMPLAEQMPDDVLAIALQLAYRVRDLHEIRVPHGDLQPGNAVVHQGELWLIDVAPVETRPGETGHVAGSAPLMAPELWSGAAPSLASDVYALASLVAWLFRDGRYPLTGEGLAGWAEAHRGAERDLEGVPERLAGVLRRTMDPEPDARPGIQTLIDTLRETGADVTIPPVVTEPLDTAGHDRLTTELTSGGVHLQLAGPRRSGRTWVARRLQAQLTAAGRQTIFLAPGSIPTDEHDAWRAVRALLDGVSAATGRSATFPLLRGGDRLNAFEQLAAAALDAVGMEPVVVIWDDFDQGEADARAWWQYFIDAAQRRGSPISTVALTLPDASLSAVRVDIGSPSPARWTQWRGSTLRTEVRDISSARWEQLTQEHGDIVGQLLGGLDREVGSRAARSTRAPQRIDTGTLASMQKGWRERVARLMEQCAFAQAAETCAVIVRNLVARGQADKATSLGLLRAWTNAVVSGGGVEHADELEQTLSNYDDAAHALLRAQLLNALGRHADGLVALEGVSGDRRAEAELASWRAQLSLSSGRLDQAKEHAALGLEYVEEATPEVRSHLLVLRDAGDAIRGEPDAIAKLEELIPELEKTAAPALLKARLHAYRAIGLTRAEALDEATDAHLRALEQIESGGLAAELPTYLLNAGTAYNRQGRLGLAREYYARGLRLAQPTTRASTRALLFANQANVDLALGRLDEARTLIDRGEVIAEREGLNPIVVMCRSVRGDIELAARAARRAIDTYSGILEDADELQLSPAQSTEIHLALAEACFADDDPNSAAGWLDSARRQLEEHQLVELENLHGILRARLQWAEGSSVGTMAGIELFRRNLIAAHDAGDHRLVLRQVPHLVRELQAEGLDELLAEVTGIGRDSRNAIAMGLGRELRRDFFANLPSFDEPTVPSSVGPASAARPVVGESTGGSTGDVEPFYRMLSLNEVILRAERLDEMLPDALDIALTLSHAERGFILLRDETSSRVGRFEVAASRDVDGDAIPSPHLEVSLTIAEEAAQTGRTVVTLNARQDGRFSEALSVVDLDLTSVLCVPIRAGSGLLGALYVDHRFRPGVFEGEVPRMMEAFGHQLALAITNARRVQELEATRSQLSDLLEERETMLRGLEQRVGELTDQVEQQRADASLRSTFPDIAFGSRAMEKVLSQVERVARGDIPVVVTGESGVGKELIARAIHDASPRRSGPFVAFNCGAVSESLFESEMFGHIKGAFTGADIDRQGLFHAASGGTIFLDEIGEMPLSMQVKLLRVLQERQIRRVGETKSIPIDVRVVAATNRDLMEMVGADTFREDLYYRLAAFVIEIPALRDRREDIPLIASTLLERIADDSGYEKRLTAEGARLLMRSAWAGNIRELENTLRAAAVMADGEELGEAELAPLVRLAGGSSRTSSSTGKVETRGRRPKATRLDVVEALRRANDDRERAAEILGVSERTMYRYMKKWDLYG